MEDEIFELDYEDKKIKVHTTTVQEQVLFRVTFSDGTPPVTLCRALNFEQKKFWTCMPESVNKQLIAQKIGPLIESYYRIKLNK
jgi:hypothetical protein